MNKKKSCFLIGIFTVLILLPCLIYPFCYVNEEEIKQTENRVLAEKPVLSLQTLKTFPVGYESYYNDRLPFRKNLIQLNSMIDYYVFNESSSNDVVKGKDGWLFYSMEADGNPMANYLGQSYFTDEELETIKNNMVASRDNLAQKGIDFVLFIAPDKVQIYDEYLPDDYERVKASKATQLVNYLRKETDLTIVYPYDALLQAKEAYPQYDFYFHLDTHWNELGGYVGANELLNALGTSLPSLDNVTIQEKDTSQLDLSKILNLQNMVTEDTGYCIDEYQFQNVNVIADDFNTQYHYECAEPLIDKKVMIARDSFSIHMRNYLASAFRESVMYHRLYFYQNEYISQQNPDIFIYQIVERQLPDLKTTLIVP